MAWGTVEKAKLVGTYTVAFIAVFPLNRCSTPAFSTMPLKKPCDPTHITSRDNDQRDDRASQNRGNQVVAVFGWQRPDTDQANSNIKHHHDDHDSQNPSMCGVSIEFDDCRVAFVHDPQAITRTAKHQYKWAAFTDNTEHARKTPQPLLPSSALIPQFLNSSIPRR